MKTAFIAEELVDLQNDAKFEKLASFANQLDADELNTNLTQLIEKQAYAEDSTYADPMNRIFSIATPVETKISALYATKCASLLEESVVNRLNDACRIYGIDIEVPVVNKVASVENDPEIMNAIQIFDDAYDMNLNDIRTKTANVNYFATEGGYGTELDNCLAARAYYATEAEDIEALNGLAKLASSIEPAKMVEIIREIDSQLGLDNPYMQNKVGTPEYAVYEKVASENMVNLGSTSVPLSAIANFEDEIRNLGVTLDWDGESGDALQLQIENLPSQIKDEIASWVR